MQEVLPVLHLLPGAILPQESHRSASIPSRMSSREIAQGQNLLYPRGPPEGVGLQGLRGEGAGQELLSSVQAPKPCREDQSSGH